MLLSDPTGHLGLETVRRRHRRDTPPDPSPAAPGTRPAPQPRTLTASPAAPPMLDCKMTAVIKYSEDLYKYMFIEKSDPRANQYFLINSPGLLASILLFYYYFVYYGGRQWMENRKPFNLNTFMVVYNAIQTVANMYIFVKGMKLLIEFDAPFSCLHLTTTTTRHDWEVVSTTYLYFLLKISDLTDTVFMVLRKNYHQISFLHVYHHIGMVIGTWCVTKYIPGGHGAVVGIINAIVHIVMYMYYLICALYPHYKANIWWKKNITQIQVIQFVVLSIHHAAALFNPSCNYPKVPLAIFMSQALLMFVLFSKFYIKTYIQPKKKTASLNGNDKKQM
ncbi:elongation of very long chain fatty acids protein 1-like [Cimex lectularius]|uniref:Elongation of very long chain fatty acids protein n=1 Tax=Cimex lectularius TaxID=79782 RepID=A0A8I6RL40_CIMLE|nr:elongation of very long chain fatty acids protein 1-like [Cimex lectularius]